MVRFMLFLTEQHVHRKIAIQRAAFLFLLLAASLAGCAPASLAALPADTQDAPSLTATDMPAQPSASQKIPAATPSPTQTAALTPAPRPSSTPTSLACWAAGGRFESGSLETDLLRHPLEYRVYLPPCYDQQTVQAYPVLYLIHGQSYNDDQWERLGAGELAGELVSTGELPPFLMVMPRDRLWSEPSEDLFGQAMVEVLLPLVEANYRTIPEGPFRAVGGLSRGGAWALHLGLTYPELFSAVGMHSGFVFHSDAPYLRTWLETIPAEQMPRFYLDVADNDRPDIYDSAVWFEAMLTEYNIPHEWHVFIGYHEEAYWQAHVEQYLRWYAQKWTDER
jgi:enterochelin esterase-like enzyme